MKTFIQPAGHSDAPNDSPFPIPHNCVPLVVLTAILVGGCGVDEQLAEVTAAANERIEAASRENSATSADTAITEVGSGDADMVSEMAAEGDADETPAAALPAANTDELPDGHTASQSVTPDNEEPAGNASAGNDTAPDADSADSASAGELTPDEDTANRASAVDTAGDQHTGDNADTPDSTPSKKIATTTDEPEPQEQLLGESDVKVTSPTTLFESSATPGFTGEILRDGSLRIRWPLDSEARGYNVYRDSVYYTTEFETEFVDTDIVDKDYYFEIHAFDHDDNFSVIATGLTVEVRGTGRPDPESARYKRMDLSDYELVFADEFNGYELDTSKWNTQFLWGPDLVINSELQYYVDTTANPDFGYQPFVFDGESISIRAQKTPEHLMADANGQPYLSGILTSYDAFKFTYGYAEIRARVPFGRGFWPAFWLLNAYYVNAKPEIDIMEFIGSDRDVVYHTYHYYDEDGNLRSTHSQPTTGIDFTNGYHTYAVEWRPGLLVFYVDGIERHRITDVNVSSQQMYVIANLAVGGWWAGAPDSSTPFPAEYKIDYIRLYQKAGNHAEMPYYDGIQRIPLSSRSKTSKSSGHRPTPSDWPEGYPEGL